MEQSLGLIKIMGLPEEGEVVIDEVRVVVRSVVIVRVSAQQTFSAASNDRSAVWREL